ncbi:MAG: hypothetical protein PHQ60_08815 [Sideroxydans sp.]|nr:hypothetical protein [Sideroxydans sp.]
MRIAVFTQYNEVWNWSREFENTTHSQARKHAILQTTHGAERLSTGLAKQLCILNNRNATTTSRSLTAHKPACDSAPAWRRKLKIIGIQYSKGVAMSTLLFWATGNRQQARMQNIE